MKKLAIILLLGITFGIKAQSGTEMQLSKFITAKIAYGESVSQNNAYGGYYKSVGTVPAGKVWKVTGASAKDTGLGLSIKHSSDQYATPFELISPYGTDDGISMLPIYITENHEVYIFKSASSSSSTGAVSIIEYTVN